MAQAGLRERVSRWQEELACLEPSTLRSEFFLADQHRSVSDLDGLRAQMRRDKIRYHSVQTQVLLAQGWQNYDVTSSESLPGLGQDLASGKKEAKEKIKEQKADVARETVNLAALYADASNGFAEASQLHAQTVQALQEVRDIVNQSVHNRSDDVSTARMQSEAEELSRVEEQVAAGTRELTTVLQLRDEEQLKRRRLDNEKLTMEQVLKEYEAQLRKMQQLEKEWDSEAKTGELLDKRAEEMLLRRPRVDFDDARNVLVLSDAAGGVGPGREPEAVRTIKVEYDKHGRLVRAEAHPSLELWPEATIAIEQNDLARLVTIAWDRICNESEGLRHQPCFDSKPVSYL